MDSRLRGNDDMDAFDLDLQQSFCEIGCYRKADPVLERVLKIVWGRLKGKKQ